MEIDTIALLQKVEAFSNLPVNQLLWISEKGKLNTLKPGDVLFKKGEPVEKMHIILQGSLKLTVQQAGQMREVGLLETGAITGILPYSRMTHATGYGTALEDTFILSLPKIHFTEMIQQHHQMVENLVHTMTSRVRSFTRMQQQNDKMMALGKLSAGLAHELNNPSSAVIRSSRELKKHLSYLPGHFKKIIKISLSDDAISHISQMLQKKIEAKNSIKLSMLEKSAKEDEMMDWFYENHLESLEDTVENLVAFNFDSNELEEICTHSRKEDLPAILQWIDDNLTTEKLVIEIEEASKRINDLVGSVKSYTHMDQAPEKQLSNVHEGIDNTLTMLQHKLKKGNIKLIKNYQEDLPKTKIYISEMNQVWTNIIDNAIDAIETTTDPKLEINTCFNQNMLQISIEDNGPGIPDKIIDNIFDPFYTTKAVGKGTGLGLDITKRIIDQHKGSVQVKSTPGNTTFKICLPLE